MSGSISRGKNDPGQSLQMMGRPLMAPEELKTLPKGQFILAKTGCHPMQTRLPLFFKWGIRFGAPYVVPEQAERLVSYVDRFALEEEILRCREEESWPDELGAIPEPFRDGGGTAFGEGKRQERKVPFRRHPIRTD